MNDPFIIVGMQVSILVAIGSVLAMYMALTIVMTLWASMGLLRRLVIKLYYHYQPHPLDVPVLTPLNDNRRKVAFK